MSQNTDLKQGRAEAVTQLNGMPEALELNGAASLQIDAPEVQSIKALLLVEQYVSLRSEIEKRVEIRQQILTLTLLVAGTFLTIGCTPAVPEVVLLFYPFIAMLLGAIWEHNDLRVGQLNFYIRTEVEQHLGSFAPGWEAFRLQTFRSGRGRQKRQGIDQRHPLTPQFGSIAFATRGLFLTTQAVTIIVAAVRYAYDFFQQGFSTHIMAPQQIGLSLAIALLFLLDIGVLIFTGYLVQHKRV